MSATAIKITVCFVEPTEATKARFTGELTGKYDLYADDLSRIVKALSSVTDIESKE